MQLSLPAGGAAPAGADGRPHLGRRPPRPPPPRRADRDDAPPRRADPPRGRRASPACTRASRRSTAATATGSRPSRRRSRSAAARSSTRPASTTRRPPSQTRLATETGAALVDAGPRLRAARRRGRAGPGRRVTQGFYTALLRQSPQQLRDKEPMRFLFATRDGVDVGHAAFRRTHKWEQHRPQGTLEVFAICRRPRGPARAAAPAGRLRPDGAPSSSPRRRRRPAVALARPALGRATSIPADNLWLRIVDLPGGAAAAVVRR